MKIYSQYALFGMLRLFVLIFLGLTIFVTLICVIQANQSFDATFSLAIRLAPFLLFEYSPYLLLVSSFFATTAFFAGIKERNEIIALRALGVAPWKIMVPIWGLMLVLSVASVVVNNFGTPWSQAQFTKVLMNGFRSNLIKQIEKKEEYRVKEKGRDKVVILAKVDRDDPNYDLKDVTFDVYLKNCTIKGKIEKARLELDKITNDLVLFTKGLEITDSEDRFNYFVPSEDKKTFSISLLLEKSKRIDVKMSELGRELRTRGGRLERCNRRYASKISFALLCGDFDEQLKAKWQKDQWQLDYFEGEYNRCRATIPKIWTLGMACFFIAWASAPFAIWLEKRDPLLTILLSAPLFGVFIALYQICYSGAKDGTLAPGCIFSADVALFIIGCYFLKKTH